MRYSPFVHLLQNAEEADEKTCEMCLSAGLVVKALRLLPLGKTQIPQPGPSCGIECSFPNPWCHRTPVGGLSTCGPLPGPLVSSWTWVSQGQACLSLFDSNMAQPQGSDLCADENTCAVSEDCKCCLCRP